MTKRKGAPQNLIPPRTSEEAKARGKNGGIASGIARREKKTLRETLELILEMDADASLELPPGLSNKAAIVIGQIKAAAQGNPSAFREIGTLLGERIEKQEVSSTEELGRMLGDARKRQS